MAIREIETQLKEEDLPEDFDSIQEEVKTSGYWMPPLVWFEERLIFLEEWHKIKLRRRGLALIPNRDLTGLFFLHIQECIEHNQIFTCASEGTAGFGKTSSLMAVAWEIANREAEYQSKKAETEIKPKLITAIGRNDTMKAMNEITPGSVFFEDEDPFTSGDDSKVSGQAIQNVQEIVIRFHKVHYLTAAVNLKGHKRAKNLFHCYIEPVAKNEKERKTKCFLISGRTLEVLGHVNLRILPSNNSIQLAHNEKERIYNETMLSHGGYESLSLDPEELERRACRLFIYLTQITIESIKYPNKFYTVLTSKQKLRISRIKIERIKTAMRKLAYEIPGSSDQHKRIIDECWDFISKLQQYYDIEKKELAQEIKIKKELKREEIRQAKEEKKSLEKENKEKAKLQKQKQKAEELIAFNKKIESEKEKKIPNLVDQCIHYYDLLSSNKSDSRLIKHFFRKAGTLKENLEWGLAETLEKIRLYKMEKRDSGSLVDIESLFSVDSAKQFIFDEEAFLKILCTRSQINSRIKYSWKELVVLYQRYSEGGISYKQVAKELEFNVSVTTIKSYLNQVKGAIAKALGETYEVFREQELITEFSQDEIIRAGGNQSIPDIVQIKEKEIIFWSLKCYRINPNQHSRKLKIQSELAPELRECLKWLKEESNKKGIFKLDYYNVFNHTQNNLAIDPLKVTAKSTILCAICAHLVCIYCFS